jgi:hypothetical protein
MLMESYENVCEKPEFVYHESDLPFLVNVKNEAEYLWHKLAENHVDYMKGSVTIGEGFYIFIRRKGKRKPRKAFIAYASNNGSLAYEDTRHQIQAFLIEKGIKNFAFDWGRMD